MGLSTSEASNFGSALTYVGDQFAATADEVLEVSSRMAGLSTIVGADQYDLIGLAAEMKNLGLSSESASSAMTRVFMTINNAVATGDDSLKQFAEVSGMTAEQFKKAWGEDAVDTFLYFVDGLDTSVINEISDAIENNTSKVEEYASAMGMTKEKFIELFNSDKQELIDLYADSMENLSDESESASVILDDLSLTNVRTAETLLKLAGNGNVVRDAIKDANEAWSDNTALTQKANTVYQTVESRYKALYEKLKQVGSSLAEDLLPTLEKLIDSGMSILEVIDDLNPNVKKLISITALSLTGITKASKGISSFLNKIQGLDNSIKKLSDSAEGAATGGITKLCKKIVDSGGLASILSSALPVAATAAGAGLIALAGYFAVANSDAEKFKKTMDTLSDSAQQSYISSLQDIDMQFRNMPSVIDKISDLYDKLTFDDSGNVITTTDAYKNFVTAIGEYNEIMGYEAINLDEINGLLGTQGDLISNITEKYKTQRLEEERNSYLEDYKESYKEAVSTVSQYSQTLVDKEVELDNARKTFLSNHSEYTKEDLKIYEKIAQGVLKQSDYIDQYVQEHYDEVKKYASDANISIDEATDEIKQKLNDKFSQLGTDVANESIIISLLEEFNVANSIYEKALEIKQAYESVDTASLEELPGLLEKLTGTSYSIVLDYDESSLESVNGAIDTVKDKIKACDELAKQGIDTSKYRETLMEYWADLEQQRQDLESSIESTQTYMEEIGGILAGLFGPDGSVKQTIDEGAANIQSSIEIPFMNAFSNIDAYQLQEKHMSIILDYYTNNHTNSSSAYKKNGGYTSGGYFGDLVSKMPVSRIDAISDSIGRTIGNARQIQSKIASGGYSNQISLNASFNINNTGNTITQNMAKQMAKQITDLVNEELGKAL